MQGLSFKSFQTSQTIKFVCVVAFLWLNLCPTLHQAYHLFQVQSHVGCQHSEHDSETDRQQPSEITGKINECQLCQYTAQAQPLGLAEQDVDFNFHPRVRSLVFIVSDQNVERVCQQGYDARAGPITS